MRLTAKAQIAFPVQLSYIRRDFKELANPCPQ